MAYCKPRVVIIHCDLSRTTTKSGMIYLTTIGYNLNLYGRDEARATG